MLLFRRWTSNRESLVLAIIAIGLMAIGGCSSSVKVRTNNSAGLKRASTNIHTRNRRPAQPQQQPQQQPQVSLGALPAIDLAPPPDFVLGAGDSLGRSVFAHYAETQPSRRDSTIARAVRGNGQIPPR